jgi:transposase-like protein
MSCKRHRLPAEVIRQTAWLIISLILSPRDVKDILPKREIEVSCETGR